MVDASSDRSIWNRPWWLRGLGLIALVTLARLAYLLWFCPYTLIEDEAHYWEWSRRLELSYYSKGPGVAWAIRAATEVFGTHEWSVRLPSVVSGALGAWCVSCLAREMIDDPRAGLHAAAIYVCMPALFVLGIIFTIDGPYLACWAAACWMGWRAITRRQTSAWIGLGLAIAAGFVFKYTILLLLPGLIVGAWLASRDPTDRDSGRAEDADSVGSSSLARGALIAFGVSLVGLIPVGLWNAQHDWITVRHLLGHLGVQGGDIEPKPGESWSPLWTLELLGVQIAMAGPAMLLGIYAACCAWYSRENRPDDWRAARYLIACGLPVLLFYIGVSFMAEPEGNWPMAAWISAAPLGAIGVARVFPEFRRRVDAWREKGAKGIRPHMNRVMMWRWTVGVGVLVALGFARADWMTKVPGIGPLVPQGRLMFADVRGIDAARIMDDLAKETGLAPVLMAQHYGRTSQMAYYLPGRPTVYCAGAYMEGPRKQYDLWDETNIASPAIHEALAGRPALLVGGRFDQWEPAFERLVEAGQLEGEHKKGRMIYLGYGYIGFPETRPRSATERQAEPSDEAQP